MPCRRCLAVRQFAMNLALALDRLANVLLLGDPAETVSQRLARARAAGNRWAALACRGLAAVGRRLGETEDHCTWSLSPDSSGRELWRWG